MNILYINHYAGSPQHGMEYRPFYLAREWVRAGHEVTIVAASHAHVRSKQPKSTGIFTREKIDGVNYLWCQTPIYQGNGIGRVMNIAAFLYRLEQASNWLQNKPDAVIASSTYPADIYAAIRIAKKHKAALVWEVHDLWPLSPIELGGMSPLHPFILWMQHAENTACRRADLVVSMLPNAKDHLVAHGMRPQNFFHIPNGIDPSEWSDQSSCVLPAEVSDAVVSARRAGHLLVAYAGAHGVANALDTMLDAAALMRTSPITWLLVGNGPEKFRLAQRVKEERLSHVVLLEPIAKSLIPTFLRSVDVLYIGLQKQPLFRFGISPNKLMDYMMACRPVICAIAAGNDPVSDAQCGMTIPPEEPEALAHAVQSLCQLDESTRSAMGDAGRAYVEKNHLYPSLAKHFIQAIRQRKNVL